MPRVIPWGMQYGPVHFVNNKYRKWYFQIIASAHLRCPSLVDPTEGHHAVPKCFGGSDDCVVQLTHREHFIAHWLLTKFTEGAARRKMTFALVQMTRGPTRVVASWQYDTARTALGNFLRGSKVSSETRAKMRASALNRSADYRAKQSAAHRGKKASEATRAKLRALMKNLSPEKRMEMDAKRRGHKHDRDTIERMRAAHRGHPVSEQTREKIRLKQMGNRHGLGTKRTPEQIAALSAAIKRSWVARRAKRSTS